MTKQLLTTLRVQKLTHASEFVETLHHDNVKHCIIINIHLLIHLPWNPPSTHINQLYAEIGEPKLPPLSSHPFTMSSTHPAGHSLNCSLRHSLGCSFNLLSHPQTHIIQSQLQTYSINYSVYLSTWSIGKPHSQIFTQPIIIQSSCQAIQSISHSSHISMRSVRHSFRAQ